MKVVINWADATPVIISMAIPVFGLLFDKGLKRSAERYYADAVYVERARPHMITGFVTWWIDLMVYVSSAFSMTLAAALQGTGREQVALAILATTYWTAALVAAILYEPFDYAGRFRWGRWLFKRVAGRTLWEPVASPAFSLVQAGNVVAVLFAVSVDL